MFPKSSWVTRTESGHAIDPVTSDKRRHVHQDCNFCAITHICRQQHRLPIHKTPGMDLYPAIDIRGGKCVRLRQGDYSQETVFGDDPVEVAQRWCALGAAFLHLVDLDGAKAGQPINAGVVERIAGQTRAACQLGGGIRNQDSIRRILDLGVTRAIIGTQALKDPDWFEKMADAFPNRLVLGLDAREGLVATAGWLEVSTVPALDFLRRFESLPLAGVVYTDIAKDGMMQGPNFDSTAEIQGNTRHSVIASGGISSETDVHELHRRGIRGCILGRSIYEGTVSLPSLFGYFESIGSRPTGNQTGSENHQ